ncbi:MAG: hypothetical protein HRS57_03670, partial [Mycoplasmataceae bacterium]|nr:hypothetical protein [Mycoplasmataceae bacterium]
AIVYLSSGVIPVYGSEEDSQSQKDKQEGISSKISSMVADSILNEDKEDAK